MKAGYVLFGLCVSLCCGMAAAGEPTAGAVKAAKAAAEDASPVQEVVAAVRLPDPVPLLPNKVAPPPLLEAPPRIAPPVPQLSRPKTPEKAPSKAGSAAARESSGTLDLQSATTP